MVDLFLEHPTPFDQMWNRSSVVTLRGLPVRVASIDDLVALKRAAGRPDDLADVEALTKLQQIRSQDRPL
jgi:hypothetical protein